MTYEKYIAPSKGGLSISPKGLLQFGVGVTREFDLQKYEYCFLHYDKSKKLIGFEFLREQQKGAIKLRSGGTQLVMSIKGFLNYWGIAPLVTTRYYPSKGHKANWITVEV